MADGSIGTTAISPRLEVSPEVQEKMHNRLYAQHSRIFQTISVIETLRDSISAKDENGDDDQLTAYFGVLTLMHDTLTDIAEQIEPGSILQKEALPAEQFAIARAARERREAQEAAAKAG